MKDEDLVENKTKGILNRIKGTLMGTKGTLMGTKGILITHIIIRRIKGVIFIRTEEIEEEIDHRDGRIMIILITTIIAPVIS